MIFGEIVHDEHYYDVFSGLLELLKSEFNEVESGVQGDAWIWIFENGEKVAIDSFTSMRFQLKSDRSGGVLLEKVLSVLQKNINSFSIKSQKSKGTKTYIKCITSLSI